jgi:hypothetical protein
MLSSCSPAGCCSRLLARASCDAPGGPGSTTHLGGQVRCKGIHTLQQAASQGAVCTGHAPQLLVPPSYGGACGLHLTVHPPRKGGTAAAGRTCGDKQLG